MAAGFGQDRLRIKIDSIVLWTAEQLRLATNQTDRSMLYSLRLYAPLAAAQLETAKSRMDFTELQRKTAKMERAAIAFIVHKMSADASGGAE